MGTLDVSESHSATEHGKPGASQSSNAHVSVLGSSVSSSLDLLSNLCSSVPKKE